MSDWSIDFALALSIIIFTYISRWCAGVNRIWAASNHYFPNREVYKLSWEDILLSQEAITIVFKVSNFIGIGRRSKEMLVAG